MITTMTMTTVRKVVAAVTAAAVVINRPHSDINERRRKGAFLLRRNPYQ
jgi:hypothetical protein